LCPSIFAAYQRIQTQTECYGKQQQETEAQRSAAQRSAAQRSAAQRSAACFERPKLSNWWLGTFISVCMN